MKLRMLLFFISVAFAASWKRVGEILEEQPFFEDIAITVGKKERVYSYLKGNITLQKRFPIASASKMVSSTMFMQLIEQGKLSLEDYAKDYINFWTKDPNDTRSLIQVKHCLTFTSGYSFGLTKFDGCLIDDNLVDCVQKKYETYSHSHVPGTLWDYNEFHQQIVAVMVVNITNTSITKLLRNHLDSMNMTRSFYMDRTNPDLSGYLISTGDDYEQFMLRLWNGQVINDTSKAIMFKDSTANINVSEVSWLLRVAVGTYGFTNYFECPFWVVRGYPEFPKECKDADVHSDPGAYGWWPLYDLKNDYFFQLIDYGPFLIGSVYGFFVRMMLKPFIDRAIKGEIQPPLDSIDWEAWMKVKECSDPLEAILLASKINA